MEVRAHAERSRTRSEVTPALSTVISLVIHGVGRSQDDVPSGRWMVLSTMTSYTRAGS